MCSHWESNPEPFLVYRTMFQPTEPLDQGYTFLMLFSLEFCTWVSHRPVKKPTFSSELIISQLPLSKYPLTLMCCFGENNTTSYPKHSFSNSFFNSLTSLNLLSVPTHSALSPAHFTSYLVIHRTYLLAPWPTGNPPSTELLQMAFRM